VQSCAIFSVPDLFVSQCSFVSSHSSKLVTEVEPKVLTEGERLQTPELLTYVYRYHRSSGILEAF